MQRSGSFGRRVRMGVPEKPNTIYSVDGVRFSAVRLRVPNGRKRNGHSPIPSMLERLPPQTRSAGCGTARVRGASAPTRNHCHAIGPQSDWPRSAEGSLHHGIVLGIICVLNVSSGELPEAKFAQGGRIDTHIELRHRPPRTSKERDPGVATRTIGE